MVNDSKTQGIDVSTATDATDDSSELDNLERQAVEAAAASTLPSGSRTWDRRLNPDAPDFVPGLGAATLLAVKIVNEPDYPRWSNAASELDAYGPRYDSIWRESCLRAQVEEASNEAAANRVEVVGDGEQSPAQSVDKRLKAASDMETASTTTTAATTATTTGRCCGNCALM